MKNKEPHQYGAFVDSFHLKNIETSEMAWMSKLCLNQARLISKQVDSSSDMVALIPRFSFMLPPPSFLFKHNYDESLLPSAHLPRSLDLNFSPVDPSTGEILPEYNFPYFSSYFQDNSQLLLLETRIDPLSHARKYHFSEYFCLPKELPLNYYSPDDIKHLLHFIPGEIFTSQLHYHCRNRHIGFFLFHIVSADVLVPILNTMVLTLLQPSLPGDNSLWAPLLTDMQDFSNFFT